MCVRARIGLPSSVAHVLKGRNMNHMHGVRPRFSALSSAIADSLQTALAPARRPHVTGVKSAVISASSGLLVPSALAVGLTAIGAGQEPGALGPVEEVTATGSRIRREDFTANAPVVSVDEAMFDQTSSIGVETILNRLPQFTPAVTQ